MINRFLQSEVKSEERKAPLKGELAHLAHTYYSRYHPSETTIRKHNILKKLKQNTDIIICRPDKGSGVVILDRTFYISSVKKLLNDEKEIKKLSADPTHLREGHLERYLRQLNISKNFSDKKTYDEIFHSGSQYARMYGLPKLHKVKDSCPLPPFRPIVSSIGTYNNELAKYLCNFLTPAISYDHCTKESFTFAEEIQNVRHPSLFMVSFDIKSFITNIPLAETINLAVDAILKNNPNLKIRRKDLKTLFEFTTRGTHFSFDGDLMIVLAWGLLWHQH